MSSPTPADSFPTLAATTRAPSETGKEPNELDSHVRDPKAAHEKDVEKGSSAGEKPNTVQDAGGMGYAATLDTDERPDEDHEVIAKENPNIVDWDGPDDPENPMNWSDLRRWSAMLTVGMMCFVSPFASTLVAPAVPSIVVELGIENNSIASLVVSIFVMGYALGPLVASPLSEIYGRAIVLQGFMFFFFIFNIACAVSQTTAQLIVFRFLAGVGGSAPITIGAGTLSDIFRVHERGLAMSVFTMGPLIGPVVGPVAGAWLSMAANWRDSIWLLVGVSGLTCILGVFLLNETYHPTLLARKAKKLRAETGNQELITVHEYVNAGRTKSVIIRENLSRPFVLLFADPAVIIVSVYQFLCYGYYYLMFVTFGEIFIVNYHQSTGIAGLHFIAPGLGAMTGTVVCGATMDRVYVALTKRNGGEGRPEFRVPIMFAAGLLLPVGLLIYGWSAQYNVHWIVPDIGVAIFSSGVMISFLALGTYTIDAFKYAASALAATTVLRSIGGALFPLFGQDMFDALGLGWGNTLLALVALSLGATYPWVLWRYGPALRARGKANR